MKSPHTISIFPISYYLYKTFKPYLMKTNIILLWGSYVVSLLGVIFKTQHWPGANILLLTAFICMAIATIWTWLNQKDITPSWINHTASSILLFFVVSAAVSVFHWPGSDMLRTIGYFLCMAFPGLILLHGQLSLSKEYWIIYASWVMVVLLLSTVKSLPA